MTTLTNRERRIYEAVWQGATIGKPPTVDELRDLFSPVATHFEIRTALGQLEQKKYLVPREAN